MTTIEEAMLVADLQQQCEIAAIALQLADDERWKALVSMLTKRHNTLLAKLASKQTPDSEIRYLQGQIKELTAIILTPAIAQKSIQKNTDTIGRLRDKAARVDSDVDMVGVFNPDPDIEALIQERNKK